MDTSRPLHLGSATIDLDGHVVRTPAGGDTLTPLEATLLAFLAEHRGSIVSRDRLLEHVWDYSPRTVSRAVDHAVSRLRKKIEVDPAQPRWITSIRGAGYRLEEAGSTALVPPSQRPTPGPLGPFFGRREALEALCGLGRKAWRLLTVQGPPGVGKTRLCREHLRRLDPSERAIAWLADVLDANDLVAAVARALEILGSPTSDRLEHVGQVLRQRGPYLLVLDNAEHLLPEVREAVRVWLALAPALRIVVTSRHPLGVPQEQVLPLGPLDAADAVALMVYRARQVRGHFEPNPGEIETLERISVRQLDGLPLALELAASRLGVLDPHGLEQRLSDRFRLLTDKRPDAQWTSLEAALRWSWDLLTPPERAALAQATVFVGEFDLAAAEVVIEPPEGWVPDLLQELVAHALIQRVGATPPRFRLLQSVRDLAMKLGGPGLARARHRQWCAEQAAPLSRLIYGASATTATARLTHMQADLRAAHAHAIEARESAAAVSLVRALARIAMQQGTEADCVALLQQTLALLPEGDAAWVELRWMYGVALARTHHPQQGIDVLEASLAQARDPALLRDVLTALTMLMGEAGPLERFREVGAQALQAARATHDLRTEGVVLHNLAAFESSRGSVPDAAEFAERSRRIAVQVEDVELEVAALQDLSNIAMVSGQSAQALDFAEQALPRARAHDLRAIESTLAITVARLTLELGRVEESVVRFAEAVSFCERIGHLRGAFFGRLSQSLALIDAGLLDEADTVIDVMAHESGPIPGPAVGMIEVRRALVACARGDAPQAEHWARAALEQVRTTPTALPRVRAQAAAVLAGVLARRGAASEAEGLQAEVAEVLGASHDPMQSEMIAVTRAAALTARSQRLRDEADALVSERHAVIAALAGAHRDVHRLLGYLPRKSVHDTTA